MNRALPLLLCLLLAACGGGGDADAPRAQPTQAGDQTAGAAYTLTLRAGQPTELPAEALTLKLGTVEDSRCPAQVQCVWAGEARVSVNVAQAGQAAADLALVIGASQDPKASPKGTYRGYTITLQALEPTPQQAGPVALDQYRATVRVER